MNNIILRGRLTADAEVKKTTDNKSMNVARFTLAVPDRTHRTEKDEYDTDFIKIVAFGSLADSIEKYTGKGTEILLTGRLHTYSYEKNNRKVYMTEVVAEHVEFIAKCTNDEKNPDDDKKTYR